jgi:hypothetical protein
MVIGSLEQKGYGEVEKATMTPLCPRCGAVLEHDEVDIGVGMVLGAVPSVTGRKIPTIG